MIIFLDTEFTDLVIEPRLLSIGLVAAAGMVGEFYAEVTDRARTHAACWFAINAVLPQFGRVPHASCSYASLGARLHVFIDRVVASLDADERVEVAFTHDLDWELAQRALRDGGAIPRDAGWRRLHPRNIRSLTESAAGRRESEAYFSRQPEGAIARHHALCDARALQMAYDAASVQREISRAATPSPSTRVAEQR